MQGAFEYANLFKTGQYGRLYLVSGGHARGRTFHIFVLPEGEMVPNSASLNPNAVEVYGITGGHAIWTETYGWLHEGKWQQDFAAMVKQRQAELSIQTENEQKEREEADRKECERRAALLATY